MVTDPVDGLNHSQDQNRTEQQPIDVDSFFFNFKTWVIVICFNIALYSSQWVWLQLEAADADVPGCVTVTL